MIRDKSDKFVFIALCESQAEVETLTKGRKDRQEIKSFNNWTLAYTHLRNLAPENVLPMAETVKIKSIQLLLLCDEESEEKSKDNHLYVLLQLTRS